MKQLNRSVFQQALRAFFGTILQCIVFGTILTLILSLLYDSSIPRWIAQYLNLFYFLFPLLCAILFGVLIHHGKLQRNAYKNHKKVSVHRLIAWLACIIGFLLIGLFLCFNVGATGESALQLFLNQFLLQFGWFGEVSYFLVDNPFYYLMIAAFPFTYALVEYFFAPVKLTATKP